MPKRKGWVIIDTNLWISFLLTKDFSRLDKIFSGESIVLLFSQELLDEFIEVASRPKFKKYFTLCLGGLAPTNSIARRIYSSDFHYRHLPGP